MGLARLFFLGCNTFTHPTCHVSEHNYSPIMPILTNNKFMSRSQVLK